MISSVEVNTLHGSSGVIISARRSFAKGAGTGLPRAGAGEDHPEVEKVVFVCFGQHAHNTYRHSVLSCARVLDERMPS
jgi:hypothetical protein